METMRLDHSRSSHQLPGTTESIWCCLLVEMLTILAGLILDRSCASNLSYSESVGEIGHAVPRRQHFTALLPILWLCFLSHDIP